MPVHKAAGADSGRNSALDVLGCGATAALLALCRFWLLDCVGLTCWHQLPGPPCRVIASMAGRGDKRLALAVYRAMLKWSRTNADVPFSLRPGDVHALAPHGSAAAAALSLQDAAAIPPIARAEFDACRQLEGEEAEEALDRGIDGVRLLHTVYSQQVQGMREVRRDREDKTGVKFAVGQVFIHKKVRGGGGCCGCGGCAARRCWRAACALRHSIVSLLALWLGPCSGAFASLQTTLAAAAAVRLPRCGLRLGP